MRTTRSNARKWIKVDHDKKIFLCCMFDDDCMDPRCAFLLLDSRTIGFMKVMCGHGPASGYQNLAAHSYSLYQQDRIDFDITSHVCSIISTAHIDQQHGMSIVLDLRFLFSEVAHTCILAWRIWVVAGFRA